MNKDKRREVKDNHRLTSVAKDNNLFQVLIRLITALFREALCTQILYLVQVWISVGYLVRVTQFPLVMVPHDLVRVYLEALAYAPGAFALILWILLIHWRDLHRLSRASTPI